MKKLIYSQEDVNLMISIETQQYQEELEYQKEENKKQKEVLDKIKEYIKEHIRIDDEYPDYMEMLVDEYHQLLELLEEIE